MAVKERKTPADFVGGTKGYVPANWSSGECRICTRRISPGEPFVYKLGVGWAHPGCANLAFEKKDPSEFNLGIGYKNSFQGAMCGICTGAMDRDEAVIWKKGVGTAHYHCANDGINKFTQLKNPGWKPPKVKGAPLPKALPTYQEFLRERRNQGDVMALTVSSGYIEEVAAEIAALSIPGGMVALKTCGAYRVLVWPTGVVDLEPVLADEAMSFPLRLIEPMARGKWDEVCAGLKCHITGVVCKPDPRIWYIYA